MSQLAVDTSTSVEQQVMNLTFLNVLSMCKSILYKGKYFTIGKILQKQNKKINRNLRRYLTGCNGKIKEGVMLYSAATC